MCDRWLATKQNVKPKTLVQKGYVGGPVSGSVQIGAASQNGFVTVLPELFDFVVRDNCVAKSPRSHLKFRKREKPIRLTSTFEQFKAIIADVRGNSSMLMQRTAPIFIANLGGAETDNR